MVLPPLQLRQHVSVVPPPRVGSSELRVVLLLLLNSLHVVQVHVFNQFGRLPVTRKDTQFCNTIKRESVGGLDHLVHGVLKSLRQSIDVEPRGHSFRPLPLFCSDRLCRARLRQGGRRAVPLGWAGELSLCSHATLDLFDRPRPERQ